MTDTAGGISGAILERFSEKRAPTENEYLGENGLLYCSKCHTPVQCRVNMFGTPKIVGCVCKCRREEEEKRKAQERELEHQRRISQLKANGIQEKHEMVEHMKHPCKVTYYPNDAEKKCNSYTALKKSNLKEMRIVRYADDFKIFCRTKEDAEKTYYAVKDWLWKRLRLEVSDEKSKVTNLRKRDSEFLGFRLKLRRKRSTWVITSNVCDKAIHRISKEMSDSVKAIISWHRRL